MPQYLMNYFLQKKEKAPSLNDKKISVSGKTTVLTSNLVTGFPYTYINMPNGPLEVFSRLIRKGIPVRRLALHVLIFVGLPAEDLMVFMNINWKPGIVLPVI